MMDKQKPVVIRSSELSLEGILTRGSEGKRPVLLCSPHPLYGGNMHYEVIVTVAEELFNMGHAVLRFNYRGVGKSEGDYSGGRGEAEDTCRAADFLKRETDSDRIMVCAYSFGAWVTMLCRQGRDEGRDDLSPLILISPPNAMMDFDFSPAGAEIFVFAGTRDDYCDINLVSKQLPAKITPINGADHFYGYGLDELIRQICKVVEEMQGRMAMAVSP